MAMNGNSMGQEIEDAVEAAFGGSIPDTTKAKMVATYKAIATAIVAHIKSNMVVSSDVSVTSVAGVTPGPGVSGAGNGTAASSSIT